MKMRGCQVALAWELARRAMACCKFALRTSARMDCLLHSSCVHSVDRCPERQKSHTDGVGRVHTGTRESMYTCSHVLSNIEWYRLSRGSKRSNFSTTSTWHKTPFSKAVWVSSICKDWQMIPPPLFAAEIIRTKKFGLRSSHFFLKSRSATSKAIWDLKSSRYLTSITPTSVDGITTCPLIASCEGSVSYVVTTDLIDWVMSGLTDARM
mmetsp:Transcript_19650/g.41223  ORF Transcript_19650/g.41223 Transcript_19650/m.41223 type:complete len:209 (+) Transcript_19650:2415-3041(+)